MNRFNLKIKPLAQRENKVYAQKDMIPVDAEPSNLSDEARKAVEQIAADIQKARKVGRSRMLTFGAHTIKNGMAPTLIALLNEGWFTHYATNGAGIIHDWELSFQGKTSEDVRKNVAKGEFGTWEETGLYINLAINIGAYLGLGYGESVGQMVLNNGLSIPSVAELEEYVKNNELPNKIWKIS